MSSKMIRYLILLHIIFCAKSIIAQNIIEVKCEYTYHAPENVTIEQAKYTALERAKLQAIADKFGTIVSQSSSTFIKNSNGISSTDFFSLGNSEVKGEWIETISEPKYNIYYEQNMLVVDVSVTGKIREIISAKIDCKAKILRNGIEDKFESSDFKNDDYLYLSFTSPVDGYLAVYLVDANKQAFCLLPYRNSSDGIYRIKANQPYLFFNAKSADINERSIVDEYFMTCSGESEQNQIYIIFSPQSFAKASDNNIDNNLPQNLNYADFQKWLVKHRKHVN